MNLKNFKTPKIKLEEIVFASVPKGKFIHFQTGTECRHENQILKGDVFLGVMPNEDNTESIGVYEYNGECLEESNNYKSLFNQKINQ